MSKSKIILFAVSGFVALLVFGAVALLFFVDANAYKPRLEATASDALGMEVRVGGRMGIGFFPGLVVTLEDLHIRNRGADVASAKEAVLGIDLLPLLHREVRVRKIALKYPRDSPSNGTTTVGSTSRNRRRPEERYPPWKKFPFRTELSSTPTNNPGKDSRPRTAIWTCPACNYQAGKARTA